PESLVGLPTPNSRDWRLRMTTAAHLTLPQLRRSKKPTLVPPIPVPEVAPIPEPVVTVTNAEVPLPPQVRQLIVRLLDGGTIPFRDFVRYEIREGVLYVFQRSQDTTERVGSRQVVVTSTMNVMIPMNRVIRLEDKLVVPKA